MTTQLLLDLLASSDKLEYIGEPVSQLEHALQCGFRAQKSHASDAATLAALFHDIGHFCGEGTISEMGGFGVLRHEEIGAQFLLDAGFSKEVADLVRGHVQAKRYLVAKNAAYAAKVSEASQQTLTYQGGPMSPDELAEFERDPRFKEKLRVRQWDELAKEPGLQVPGLESYRQMISRNLGSIGPHEFALVWSPNSSKDFEAIGALLVQSFVEEGHSDRAHIPRFRSPSELQTRGEIVVARSKDAHDRIAGVAILCQPTGPARQVAHADEAEIQLLAVDPLIRGKGIGGLLVRDCERRAARLGYSKIVLSTQPAMKAAHRVYEREGYRRNVQRDWSRPDGRQFWVYEKSLAH